MDNNILNNLVLYKGKWFSDLIDTAKISAASQQNPYQVATVLSYVFGTKDNGYNTSLDMLTGGLGNVMTIDQPSWEWNVMIDADRAVTIRDANGMVQLLQMIQLRVLAIHLLCCGQKITGLVLLLYWNLMIRNSKYVQQVLRIRTVTCGYILVLQLMVSLLLISCRTLETGLPSISSGFCC